MNKAFIKYLRSMSVRTNLTIAIALVNALLILIFFFHHINEDKKFLRKQLTEHTLAIAKTLGITSSPWVLARDLAGIGEIIKSQKNYSDLIYSMVISPDGQVLGHSDSKLVGKYVNDALSREILASESKQFISFESDSLVEAASPIILGDKKIGWTRVALEPAIPLAQIETEVHKAIFYTLISILVSSLVSWFIARLLTGQLAELVNTANSFGKGNRLVRADETSNNEVGRLAAEFNRVLDKLEVEEQKIKLSERKLRASEERLNIALSSSTDGIWDLNFNSLKIYFSDKWLKMLGYEQGDLKPDYSELIKLVHPEDFETRERIFEDHIKGLILVYQSVHRMLHKNGDYIWIEEKGQVIYDENNKPFRFIGTCNDVSEKKQIEFEKEQLFNQLRQSQKMEAIGQLTSGIAHDFNNILSGVMGYADLTVKRCQIDDSAKNYLGKIVHATERAKNLVSQMLSFSKGNDSANSLLNLNQQILQEQQMLRSVISSEIEIQTEIPEEPLFVMLGQIELQQILLNLCLNARDAISGNNGFIKLIAQKKPSHSGYCSSCGHTIIGNWVILSVVDSGKGISPSIQKNIFNPFFTTKAIGEGSGMGLSIVHGIVHRHGGHIELVSTPEGTCFNIYLPLPISEGLALPIIEKKNLTKNPEAAKNKLLIVDDEDIIRDMLKDLFSQTGYEVILAKNGLEAFHLISDRDNQFSMLLTDQTMPTMNGIKLIEETRKIFPNLPIIMITGNIDLKIDNLKKQFNITEIVFKPFNLNELRILVNTTLSKNNSKDNPKDIPLAKTN